MTTPLPELEPGHYATKQHMELIAAKRDKLEQTLRKAEEQYVVAVCRDWDAGLLSWAELGDAYAISARNRLPGFGKLWTDAGLPSIQKISWQSKNRAPEGGYWFGSWPHRRGEVRPLRGDCIVYVLFNELQPVYVGSTQDYSARMGAHRRDGKVWTSWVAYPCRDRVQAYEVEAEFLAKYLPALNKKAGR